MNTASTPPWLTESEINELCAPLTQSAAQIKALRGMGMVMKKKPNGRPLVARSEFERAMSGASPPQAAQSEPEPSLNVAGLAEWAAQRKKRLTI